MKIARTRKEVSAAGGQSDCRWTVWQSPRALGGAGQSKAVHAAIDGGKLPRKTLQLFFRNWGAYTIEINTLTACTYHRNITFLKVNRDLMGPIGEKIADEFIHPKPPGHFLVMMETAKA